jgi:hypothetical protein
MRFRLPRALWMKLSAGLKRSDLHALAGDYLPRRPSPDSIVYTTTVGRDAVRTTDGYPFPHRLEPLITALHEALALGERRLRGKAG